MTVELKRDDTGLLISLLTRDMDRVGEVKEKYGFCDPSYFYRLVDMRNKLLAMPVAEELPAGFNDKEVGELSSVGIGINKEVQKPGFDDSFPYITLPADFRSQRTLSQHKAGHALWRQVIDKMLDPGIVGVAGGGNTVLPASVIF